MYSVSKNPTYFSLAAFVLLIVLVLVATLKPYKQLKRNTIDIIVFLIAIAICVSYWFTNGRSTILCTEFIQRRLIWIILTPVILTPVNGHASSVWAVLCVHACIHII